jgi:hypothetical protein
MGKFSVWVSVMTDRRTMARRKYPSSKIQTPRGLDAGIGFIKRRSKNNHGDTEDTEEHGKKLYEIPGTLVLITPKSAKFWKSGRFEVNQMTQLAIPFEMHSACVLHILKIRQISYRKHKHEPWLFCNF